MNFTVFLGFKSLGPGGGAIIVSISKLSVYYDLDLFSVSGSDIFLSSMAGSLFDS